MKQHFVVLFFILCFGYGAKAQTTWGPVGGTWFNGSTSLNTNFLYFTGNAWWFPTLVWPGMALDAYPWITDTPPSIWTDPNGNHHYYGLLNTTNYAGGTANGQQDIIMTYDAAGNRVVRDAIYDIIATKTVKNNDNNSAIVDLDPNKTFTNSNAEITVFPNPACDKITVTLSETLGEGTSLELINSDGKVMLSQGADLYNRLDISGYPSGSYMVVLRAGKASKQWRVNKI